MPIGRIYDTDEKSKMQETLSQQLGYFNQIDRQKESYEQKLMTYGIILTVATGILLGLRYLVILKKKK